MPINPEEFYATQGAGPVGVNAANFATPAYNAAAAASPTSNAALTALSGAGSIAKGITGLGGGLTALGGAALPITAGISNVLLKGLLREPRQKVSAGQNVILGFGAPEGAGSIGPGQYIISDTLGVRNEDQLAAAKAAADAINERLAGTGYSLDQFKAGTALHALPPEVQRAIFTATHPYGSGAVGAALFGGGKTLDRPERPPSLMSFAREEAPYTAFFESRQQAPSPATQRRENREARQK